MTSDNTSADDLVMTMTEAGCRAGLGVAGQRAAASRRAAAGT
jgi:hypothetical protein